MAASTSSSSSGAYGGHAARATVRVQRAPVARRPPRRGRGRRSGGRGGDRARGRRRGARRRPSSGCCRPCTARRPVCARRPRSADGRGADLHPVLVDLQPARAPPRWPPARSAADRDGASTRSAAASSLGEARGPAVEVRRDPPRRRSRRPPPPASRVGGRGRRGTGGRTPTRSRASSRPSRPPTPWPPPPGPAPSVWRACRWTTSAGCSRQVLREAARPRPGCRSSAGRPSPSTASTRPSAPAGRRRPPRPRSRAAAGRLSRWPGEHPHVVAPVPQPSGEPLRLQRAAADEVRGVVGGDEGDPHQGGNVAVRPGTPTRGTVPAAMTSVLELRRHRELFINLTLRELRGKYKRSALGWGWSLLNPLAQMAIFSLVFGYFLKVRAARRRPERPRTCSPSSCCAACSRGPSSPTASPTAWARCSPTPTSSRRCGSRASCSSGRPVGSFGVSFLIELGVLSVALLIAGNMVLPVAAARPSWSCWSRPPSCSGSPSPCRCGRSTSATSSTSSASRLQFWFYATPIVYPISLVEDALEDRLRRCFTLYELNPMAALRRGLPRPPLLPAVPAAAARSRTWWRAPVVVARSSGGWPSAGSRAAWRRSCERTGHHGRGPRRSASASTTTATRA